jgi:hypothetical protein
MEKHSKLENLSEYVIKVIQDSNQNLEDIEQRTKIISMCLDIPSEEITKILIENDYQKKNYFTKRSS